MTELEENRTEIDDIVGKVRKEIAGLEKKDNQQRQKVYTKCDKLLLRLKELIESYELEFNLNRGELKSSDIEDSNKYIQDVTKAMQTFNKELNDYKIGKLLLSREVDIEDDDNRVASDDTLIKIGNETQQKGLEALLRTQKNVTDANALADDINAELAEQLLKLEKVQSEVKEVQVTIKRAKEFLKYFRQQILKDKAIRILLILVIIGMVAIIVLKLIGKDQGENLYSDDLKVLHLNDT